MADENLRFWPAVARCASMWSITGITVVRLGVECEKNRVASLYTCENVSRRQWLIISTTHSQYITRLLNKAPFFLWKFVLPHVPVSCHFVNGLAIFESKYKHVVCQIPVSCDIMWHHPNCEGIGIGKVSIARSSRSWTQWGSRIVVEFLITYASFHSWIPCECLLWMDPHFFLLSVCLLMCHVIMWSLLWLLSKWPIGLVMLLFCDPLSR